MAKTDDGPKQMTSTVETLGAAGSGLVSGQATIHPRLVSTVARHMLTPWRQPLHRPTVAIYASLKASGELTHAQPFILDSGCGTGQSTRLLAQRFPDHLAIGADQSKVRLAKSGVVSGLCITGNCVLLRAQLSTLWRLLLADGYWPARHFLLYPNPWPKPGHLQRRWHGHPVFPQLLTLGGEIIMRCNWEIYAQEFALAVSTATGRQVGVMDFLPETCLTPFEKKYHQRGQALFSVIVPARVTSEYRCSQRA